MIPKIIYDNVEVYGSTYKMFSDGYAYNNATPGNHMHPLVVKRHKDGTWHAHFSSMPWGTKEFEKAYRDWIVLETLRGASCNL